MHSLTSSIEGFSLSLNLAFCFKFASDGNLSRLTDKGCMYDSQTLTKRIELRASLDLRKTGARLVSVFGS